MRQHYLDSRSSGFSQLYELRKAPVSTENFTALCRLAHKINVFARFVRKSKFITLLHYLAKRLSSKASVTIFDSKPEREIDSFGL